MIKEKYTDLIIDKRRATVNFITIIQAPFIFLLVVYLFDLRLDSGWIMKWAMAFILYCLLVSGRTFLYQMNNVSNRIMEDQADTIIFKQKDTDFIPWSKYYDHIRKISFYTSIILLLFFVMLKIYVRQYYRDIFLILFYLDGGIFFFIILNSITKFIGQIRESVSMFLDSNEFNKDKLMKIRKLSSFTYVYSESLIISSLYLLILYEYWEMDLFQYIQYTLAFHILYSTTRLFVNLRRYFRLSLQHIDKVFELEIKS